MKDAPRISYSAHEGHKPEEELSALASIYELALRKADEERKAAGSNGGDEDPKGDRDNRVNASLPEAG